MRSPFSPRVVVWVALLTPVVSFAPVPHVTAAAGPSFKGADPAEVATARRSLAQFDALLRPTCVVSSYPVRPNIVLHGEVHGHPVCNAVKSSLVKEAIEQESGCMVCEEASYCTVPGISAPDEQVPASKPAVATELEGFDDPLSHALSILLRSHIELRMSQKLASRIGPPLADNLSRNAYAKQAWASVARPFADPDQESIARVFSVLLKGDSAAAFQAVQVLRYTHPWQRNRKAMQEVIAAWTRALVKIAEKEAREKFVPENLSRMVENALSGKDALTALQMINMEWRNRWMAKHILALYCEHLKKGLKGAVHIIVGDMHLEGLGVLLGGALGTLVKVEAIQFKDPFAEAKSPAADAAPPATNPAPALAPPLTLPPLNPPR